MFLFWGGILFVHHEPDKIMVLVKLDERMPSFAVVNVDYCLSKFLSPPKMNMTQRFTIDVSSNNSINFSLIKSLPHDIIEDNLYNILTAALSLTTNPLTAQ